MDLSEKEIFKIHHCRFKLYERVSTSHLILNEVNQPKLLASHNCWPVKTAGQPQLLARPHCWPATNAGQTQLLARTNCWPDPTAGPTFIQLLALHPFRFWPYFLAAAGPTWVNTMIFPLIVCSSPWKKLLYYLIYQNNKKTYDKSRDSTNCFIRSRLTRNNFNVFLLPFVSKTGLIALRATDCARWLLGYLGENFHLCYMAQTK